MTNARTLDAIHDGRRNRPVPYTLTATGRAALTASGPPCSKSRNGRPCLRDAGHRGDCDPDTGGPRPSRR